MFCSLQFTGAPGLPKYTSDLTTGRGTLTGAEINISKLKLGGHSLTAKIEVQVTKKENVVKLSTFSVEKKNQLFCFLRRISSVGITLTELPYSDNTV